LGNGNGILFPLPINFTKQSNGYKFSAIYSHRTSNLPIAQRSHHISYNPKDNSDSSECDILGYSRWDPTTKENFQLNSSWLEIQCRKLFWLEIYVHYRSRALVSYICLLSTSTPKDSLGVNVDSKQIYVMLCIESLRFDFERNILLCFCSVPISPVKIKFGLPLGIKGIRVISPRIPFTPRVILPLFPFAPILFRPGSFHPHLLIVL
jgi:hypothetical protein